MDRFSGRRACVLRNTATVKEATYWDFSEDELGVPENIQDNLLLSWTLFSQQIVKSVQANLAVTKTNYALDNFFEVKLSGDIFKPTTILGCDTDLFMVLNGPLVTQNRISNDNAGAFDLVTWTVPGSKIVITQQTIQSIVNDCYYTIEGMKRGKIPLNGNWKIVPADDDNGILVFSFQYGQFKINVFPVLKTYGESFAYLHAGNNKAELLLCEEMDSHLSLTNDTYPGFYELIKFCKVLLWEWNSSNNDYKIPHITIDVIALNISGEMTSRTWNSFSFYALCDSLLTNLESAVKEGSLNAFGRNLLQRFNKNGAELFSQWVQNIKAKPKDDDALTLLDFVQSLWKRISSNSILDNLANLATQEMPIQPPQQPVPVTKPPQHTAKKVELPNILLRDFVYTDSQWNTLCNILDATCWKAFAGHSYVNLDASEIARLDTTSKFDPTQSPSRHILQNWQYKSQATSTNFVLILNELNCAQGASYVTELVFLAELAKILDKNRYWEKFASHASSGVPKHTLDHLRYREPYDKPFLPGKSVLRQWRQSVEPMDPSLLQNILKDIGCADGVALIQKYY